MSYQENIDWLWNNHDHPAQVRCWMYPVNFDLTHVVPDPKSIEVRGGKTGNECVVEAVRAAHVGDRSKALRWLMAGQCHNDEARGEIERGGNDAVDYAVSRYGAGIS